LGGGGVGLGWATGGFLLQVNATARSMFQTGPIRTNKQMIQPRPPKQRKHTRKHARARAHTRTLTHARAHTHKTRRTRTRARTHTHTHTHTHQRIHTHPHTNRRGRVGGGNIGADARGRGRQAASRTAACHRVHSACTYERVMRRPTYTWHCGVQHTRGIAASNIHVACGVQHTRVIAAYNARRTEVAVAHGLVTTHDALQVLERRMNNYCSIGAPL
jgi:hypothetical protein